MLTDVLLLHIPGLSCFWWLLLAMLLPFLLGLLLGYWLWYQYKRLADRMEVERDDYHNRFTGMEADYAGMKYKHDELVKDNKALRSSLNSTQADLAILKSKYEKLQNAQGQDPEDADVLPVFGRSTSAPSSEEKGINYAAMFQSDNLQIIEGIGPKIEEVLKNAGYHNWSDIAGAKPEAISADLQKADPNYRIHNPATWPEQARLASEGKWEELVEFQQALDTGQTDTGRMSTPSKVEKLAAGMLGFSISRPDNLKIVEGIGPKIEQLLKEAGIDTWADLANTTVEKLKEILTDAGDRYRLANPTTWPEQARLAQAGEWQALKKYQDFLQGGNDPT